MCPRKGEEPMVEQMFGQLRTFLLDNNLVVGLCLVAQPLNKRLRTPFSRTLELFIARVEAFLIARRDHRRRVRLSFDEINTLLDLVNQQFIRAQQERTRIVEKIEASRLLITEKEQERYGQLRLLGIIRGSNQIVEIQAVIQATERVLTIQKRSLGGNETELTKLRIQLQQLGEIRQILNQEGEGNGDRNGRRGSEQQLVRP